MNCPYCNKILGSDARFCTGYIATTEEMVLAYLAKLNKSQSPYILIL